MAVALLSYGILIRFWKQLEEEEPAPVEPEPDDLDLDPEELEEPVKPEPTFETW
jgi:hypothetical protein